MFDISQFDPSFPEELYSTTSLLTLTCQFLMHADKFVSTNIPWLNVIWKSLLRLIIKQPEGTLSIEAQQQIAEGFARRFRDCQTIIDQEFSTLTNSSSSSTSSASSRQNKNEDLSVPSSHPRGFELVKFFLTLFVTFAKQFQPGLLCHTLSTYQTTLQALFILLDHVGFVNE